jgi:hypothetical protein
MFDRIHGVTVRSTREAAGRTFRREAVCSVSALP